MKAARLLVSTTLGLMLTLGALWLLGGAQPAFANPGTLYVATSGSDSAPCSSSLPCRTVQHAVDVAAAGDEIRVAGGVYTGTQGRLAPVFYNGASVVSQVVYISKTLTIRGGYTTTDWTASYPMTQPTTLDAQGQGRVLFIVDIISPTIQGLNLINGSASGLEGGQNGAVTSGRFDAGGGVFIMATGVKLQDCSIASSTAEYGGGVFLSYSPATFEHNMFDNNYAHRGGGGIYVQHSTATFTHNVFDSNYAHVVGGGAYIESSAVTLNDNTFTGNVAEYSGGVELIESPASLNHNIVIDNVAHWGGGLSFSLCSTATVNNNIVISNTAYEGGGVLINQSAPTLDGNLIQANSAHAGSGLLIRNSAGALLTNNVIAQNNPEGLNVQGSSVQLVHNTLAYNWAGSGGGLYVTNYYTTPSTVALTNTILAGQQIGINVDAGSTAILESTLWGNTTDWMGSGTIITGTHNYWGPPDFMDMANGDYHLGPASTAINQGITTTLGHDVDSETRPYDTLPDLGADETAALSIVKSAPLSVEPGGAIVYTLTVLNNSAVPLTGLVITDSIPAGAAYVSGGTRVGGVVSWTVASLAAHTATRVTYVVTSTTPLANDDYRVSAGGGYSATGRATAITRIHDRHCWVRLNNSPTNYATIQAAVDASTSSGDVVKVAGYCTMPGFPLSSQQVVRLNKTLTLRGGYTPTNWTTPDPIANPTTIDARKFGRVVYIASSSPIIEGLRLINGDTTGLGSNGGGVYGASASNATLKANQIVHNYGSGVYLYRANTALNGNTIVENYGPDGGGLFVDQGTATISRNVIARNVSNGYGGGISLQQSTVMLIDNALVDNIAVNYGGGIYLDSSGSTIQGNMISGNRAERGGGIYADACGTTGATFGENLITSNRAHFGGGLYFDGCTNTLNRNRIIGNSAEERGGGAYVNSQTNFLNNLIVDNHANGEGSGLCFSSSSTGFINNTIARNSGGSGIYLDFDVRLNLTNTIIASHTTGLLVGFPNSTATSDATLWHGNGTNWSGTINHTDDYFGDPAFLNPDEGDYHVRSNSPAVDHGVVVNTAEDIDGDPRPLGSGYDIGADESELIVTKQSDPRVAQLGAPLTYTLRITNYGQITLTATITDILPEHVTPGGNLVWTADITAPGGVWMQTVPVTIEMEHTGPLTNVVQITTLQGASGVYTHVLVPRLTVAKQANSGLVQAGERLTYTIRITNTGDFVLHATITDSLPAQVTPTGILTWTALITAPGGVWMQTVPVTATLGYSGTLTNAVEVATQEGATGTYTTTSHAQAAPALTVAKQAALDLVQAGAVLTYTIRVTNTGSTDLHAIITDTLPDQVTPTGVLTWAALITAPGGVWVQTVPVTVTAGYSGTLTNKVEVTTDEGPTGLDSVTVSSSALYKIHLPVILKSGL